MTDDKTPPNRPIRRRTSAPLPETEPRPATRPEPPAPPAQEPVQVVRRDTPKRRDSTRPAGSDRSRAKKRGFQRTDDAPSGPRVAAEGDVINLSYSSCGVLRHGGKVVFVPCTVTGDRVRYEIVRDKDSFAEGSLVEVLTPSPYRITPACPYFARCGGCHWQHIQYPYQLYAKQQITRDLIARIGGISDPVVDPTRTAGGPWTYRHRVRFQVGRAGGSVQLGFSVYNSHDVVDIERCPIASGPLMETFSAVRKHRQELSGVLDFEIYYAAGEDAFIFSALCRSASDKTALKKIPSLFKGGIIQDKETRSTSACGLPYLDYGVRSGGREFRLRAYAGGFVQANPHVNELLVATLADMPQLFRGTRILELFSGSGNFTLPLAATGSSVMAVEGTAASVKALRENIDAAGLRNVSIVASPVEEEVLRLFKTGSKFDTIFLDPPRLGAKEIMPYLSKLGARHIVYLSCNPSTLARDISILARNGYRLQRAIPFDMFPQTFHIEALAVLERADG